MKKLILLEYLLILISIFPLKSFSQNWLPLDKGLKGGITHLLSDTSDNMIYAVGSFKKVGNPDSLRGVAKWDGIKWSSVGIDSILTSAQRFGIYKYRDTLIISGIFNEWPYSSLLKLNNNTWETFPKTTGVHTTCFAEKDGILYFGGGFYACGNDSTYGLGKYDGTSFSGLTPCYQPNDVYFACMAFYQDTLYVGGCFYLYPPYYTSPSIAGLAKWDGQNLIQVNSEFTIINACTVETMVVYNNELYIGGYFTKSSGFTGDFIMKWDGHQFSEVGGGANQRVTCMKVYKNELYVGGWFTTIGDMPCNNIAKWDGNQWIALNYDAFDDPSPIRDICIYNDELYVAGNFFKIGNDSIRTIAKLNHPLTSIKKNAMHENSLNVYPNPSNGNNISVSFPYITSGDYQLLNVLGEVVSNGNIMSTDKIEINLGGIAQGCYFVKVQERDRSYVGRFIKGD